MTPVELLRYGRARIEREGLLKGRDASLYSGIIGKGCCVQTSFNGSTNGTGDIFTPVYTLFRRAMDAPGMSIIDWNDAPERTKEDVLAAFDRAIALAEGESR